MCGYYFFPSFFLPQKYITYIYFRWCWWLYSSHLCYVYFRPFFLIKFVHCVSRAHNFFFVFLSHLHRLAANVCENNVGIIFKGYSNGYMKTFRLKANERTNEKKNICLAQDESFTVGFCCMSQWVGFGYLFICRWQVALCARFTVWFGNMVYVCIFVAFHCQFGLLKYIRYYDCMRTFM